MVEFRTKDGELVSFRAKRSKGRGAKRSKQKKRHSRDHRTGRYGFEGKWDRLCVCGVRLGEHDAEPPHAGQENDCPKFRPKRR